MTIAYAKAKGLAHTVRVRAYSWKWTCPHCNEESKPVTTQREATRLAREHNDAVKHSGAPK